MARPFVRVARRNGLVTERAGRCVCGYFDVDGRSRPGISAGTSEAFALPAAARSAVMRPPPRRRALHGRAPPPSALVDLLPRTGSADVPGGLEVSSSRARAAAPTPPSGRAQRVLRHRGKFEVKTPNAVIGVIGTDFFVGNDGE